MVLFLRPRHLYDIHVSVADAKDLKSVYHLGVLLA